MFLQQLNLRVTRVLEKKNMVVNVWWRMNVLQYGSVLQPTAKKREKKTLIITFFCALPSRHNVIAFQSNVIVSRSSFYIVSL